MSEIAYHLLEFEIARAANDPRRVMPFLSDRYVSVLDVGCGAGQTLIACDLKPGVFACGVDVDEEALALGKRMSSDIALARAEGERLPFADQSFDFVISRLSLPYMRIPEALGEIARVLKPGGEVWFLLHPISMTLRAVARSLRSLNLRNLIYQHYVIVNGLLFHFTGKQFRFPFNPDKCESFQTRRGVVRAMRAAGFQDVKVELDRFFVVTAAKQG